MNKKEIKKLAEQYYYYGKELTLFEREIISKSKFKDILRPPEHKTFNKLIEKLLDSDKDIEKRKSKPYMGVDTMLISDLVDEIEEHFDLGINNRDLEKFDKINVNDLKNFINKYIDRNLYNKEITKSYLDSILKDKKEVDDILSSLYFYC